MTSKCSTCSEQILSSDYIKCDGSCGRLFHSKCVSLNKTTMNAISSNANVHWFCHECNSGNLTVIASIDSLRSSVNQMSQSLATDLGIFTNGFKSLSEVLVGSISSLCQNNKPPSDLAYSAVLQSNNKRHRDVSPEDSSALPRKKIVLGTNESNRTIAAVPDDNAKRPATTRRKSIVVSNINCDISAEYLAKFLASELRIESESIRVTPLQSNGRSFSSLQYRISAPEASYDRLMTPSTWPKNVRVCDYIFKRRSNNVNQASMESFLERESTARPRRTIVPTRTTNYQPSTQARSMETPTQDSTDQLIPDTPLITLITEDSMSNTEMERID